ncbi:hypothetical protein GF342_04375 [Candidatus Woesearchaeota archaeon]|nr:hypothetical protein [Candidatus Woesearchaeota archaeon]
MQFEGLSHAVDHFTNNGQLVQGAYPELANDFDHEARRTIEALSYHREGSAEWRRLVYDSLRRKIIASEMYSQLGMNAEAGYSLDRVGTCAMRLNEFALAADAREEAHEYHMMADRGDDGVSALVHAANASSYLERSGHDGFERSKKLLHRAELLGLPSLPLVRLSRALRERIELEELPVSTLLAEVERRLFRRVSSLAGEVSHRRAFRAFEEGFCKQGVVYAAEAFHTYGVQGGSAAREEMCRIRRLVRRRAIPEVQPLFTRANKRRYRA